MSPSAGTCAVVERRRARLRWRQPPARPKHPTEVAAFAESALSTAKLVIQFFLFDLKTRSKWMTSFAVESPAFAGMTKIGLEVS
jgi:hypothetical protein